MVRPPSARRVVQDFGCVRVLDEAGDLVAIGWLSLVSETEGEIDFPACARTPPPAGWYMLMPRIEGEPAGATLRSVGPRDPGRMLVSLDEPIEEES